MRKGQPETEWPHEKRNFLAGMIHGGFAQFGMAFSQDTTVLPSFVHALTGSDFMVGALITLKRIGVVLPQLFFAHYLESRQYKRPYLVRIIYVRSAAWFLLAFVTMFWSSSHPAMAAGLLIVLMTVFFFAGGLGEVVYSYMIARTISPTRRGRFFGLRNLIGGGAGILAGMASHRILSAYHPQLFTRNYAILFFLTATALAMAGIGFICMREPADGRAADARHLKEYLTDAFAIVKKSKSLRSLLGVNILLSGIYLALPFFVVFARVELDVPPAQIGLFITLQIIGEIVGGLGWGWLGDRYGYRVVLIGVAFLSLLTPMWAIVSVITWRAGYGLTFALAGAVVLGSKIGVRNYLLEISQEHMVPTYVALINTLSAVTLFFPFVGGMLVSWVGYEVLFLLTATVAGMSTILSLLLSEPRGKNRLYTDNI